ncbi:MAG: hypothetical protein HYU57_08370, partial [Micavibrio aeruginosavorus]|nr:hypothetical protein [Micavibrio aeruginosavorus]
MKTRLTVPVYATTLVLSAFLLFSVQLLFSKMILPLLGGSPSVWNTAMVFFQALLLAGYGYAHLTSHYMTIRKQALLHLGLLLVCLAFLPVAIPAEAHPDAGDNPTLWQLGIMAAVVGAPFFAISASAPMIQRWFAGTDHKDAANPYFLYAASNIGSMGALLAYPAAIEPLLTLKQQNLVWAAGYGLLTGLTALCALMVWKFRPAASVQTQDTAAPAPDLKTKLIWIALAFIPSSLMLGLTTYITTDIASAPLLWILPLAIYLATFIIVFARREIISIETTVALFSVFFTLYLFLMSSTMFVGKPQFFLVPPTVFFFACLLCHKKLANMRPPASHLTGFYMYMSLGGVLGGMFNSFLAPVLFPVPFEYTLAFCAVIIVFSTIVAEQVPAAAKRILPSLTNPKFLIPAAATLALLYASLNERSPALHILAGVFVVITLMSMRMKPAAYAAFACLVMIGVSPLMQLFDRDILTIERNFFGVIRVSNTDDTRNFVHGTTIHGAQP